MNEYQVMWDVCGYGARRQRILSTEASESRKHLRPAASMAPDAPDGLTVRRQEDPGATQEPDR